MASHNKITCGYSVEIQKELHELAIKNIQRNGFEGTVIPILADLRTLNINSFSEPIGTVIANPPYFPVGSGKQSPDNSKNASRFEINGSVSDFCSAASRIMRTQGSFYTVMRAERLSDIIMSIKSAGLEPVRITFVAHNRDSEPFIVLIKSERASKRSLKITPMLFMRNKDGSTTEDAERIYENCSFGDFLK
jgi:tRNA1(Val) A37 N6-methylase TrmN6